MNRKIIIGFIFINFGLLFSQEVNTRSVFRNYLWQITQSGNLIEIKHTFYDTVKQRFVDKEINLNLSDIKLDENKYQYFDISGDKLFVLRSDNICWTYAEKSSNPYSLIQIERVPNFKATLDKYIKEHSEIEWEYVFVSNYMIENIVSSSYYIEKNIEYTSSYLQYLKKETYEDFYYYIKSPWVPGKEKSSSGIGEYLDVEFAELSDNLVILNGYVDLEKRYLYKANNRVKKAKIVSLDENNPFELEYTFEDYVHLSQIDFPAKASKVRFIIEEVYKGERWDDTCIQNVITNSHL